MFDFRSKIESISSHLLHRSNVRDVVYSGELGEAVGVVGYGVEHEDAVAGEVGYVALEEDDVGWINSFGHLFNV